MSISFWSNSLKSAREFAPLTQDTQADVCIVGGGIAGIATAYLLQKSGKSVCVLEADEIGIGQTARTTAHLTTFLDTRYLRLEQLHGKEGARLAAESHHAALLLAEQIIADEKIDCDFKIVDGYVFYGNAENNLNQLIDAKKELEAIHRAGISDAKLIPQIPGVLFSSGPSILFPKQVELHPLKLIEGMVEKFILAGGAIYTHSPVVEIKGGNEAHVTTDKKHTVWCKSIVVATNSPINDVFAIHTKQAPYRSYVISARIPRGSIPNLICWDTENPYHYVRTHSDPTHPEYDILMVGGEDHKTGQSNESEESFSKLEKWMRERFPMALEITDRWSGQVLEPVDGLAFLGLNPFDRNNVYIITGHSGNGMTYALIGAQLIRDQIDGHLNAWEKLYQPSRKNFRAFKNFVHENTNTATQYLDWFLNGDVESLDDIANGEGAIVREGAHLIAGYRDPLGNLTTLSATCPHLGGVVRWNSVEKSWDCPCHGSRFDSKGNVIEGPACAHLKPYLKPSEEKINTAPISFKPVLNLSSQSS